MGEKKKIQVEPLAWISSPQKFCDSVLPLPQGSDGKHKTSDSENRQPKQKKIVTYEIILLITPECSQQLGFIPELQWSSGQGSLNPCGSKCTLRGCRAPATCSTLIFALSWSTRLLSSGQSWFWCQRGFPHWHRQHSDPSSKKTNQGGFCTEGPVAPNFRAFPVSSWSASDP